MESLLRNVRLAVCACRHANGHLGSIVLRSQLPPQEMVSVLRSAVRFVDLQLPLTQVEPMEQVVAERQASRRFNTVLCIYSVIAFSAALCAHELAIRLALGAQRSGELRLVLASGARLGLAGCVIEGVAAIFATRLLRSLLFSRESAGPVVLILVALATHSTYAK